MALVRRDDDRRKYLAARQRAAASYRKISDGRERLRKEMRRLQTRFERDMQEEFDRLDNAQYDIEAAQLRADHELRRALRRIQRDSRLDERGRRERTAGLLREYQRQVHPDDELAQLRRADVSIVVAAPRSFG